MAKSPDFAKTWFSARDWKPFAFQKQVWAAVKSGESGLLHASTGAGKTYAVWFAALNRFARSAPNHRNMPRKRKPRGRTADRAVDHAHARPRRRHRARPANAPVDDLHIPWSVGLRTGDTGSSERARQSRRLPTTLITTPESLTLLLARADAQTALSTLRMVVVDEWHELLGNKRGVQLQLALARLRHWQSDLIVWGVSATLGNQAHARTGADPTGQRHQYSRQSGQKSLISRHAAAARPSNASHGPGISV